MYLPLITPTHRLQVTDPPVIARQYTSLLLTA